MIENEDDQLNFCQNDGWNYFIFKDNNDYNESKCNNYIEEDGNNEYCQADENNANNIIINQQQYVLPEQLEYKMPNPNDNNIFPTEKPNALYFKPISQKKKKTTIIKKKNKLAKKQTKRPQLSHDTNKNQKELKNPSSANTFTLNTISNPKALFDPIMKVHELDIPRRTQDQRNQRFEKIKNYEVRFGRKVKKLDIYTNNFDAYEDLENRKYELEFKKHLYSRDKLYIKDDIRRIIESIPKEKLLYSNDNLEFNFSKYENKIEMLENQIENEKRMRQITNHKYQKMLKETEDEGKRSKKKSEKINNNNKTKSILNRRSKTPMRTFRRRQNNIMKINKSSSNINSRINKESLKDQTEKQIKIQAKIIASSLDQMIDKDIDSLTKEIVLKQEEIMNINKNLLHKQTPNKHTSSLTNNDTKQELVTKSKKKPSSEKYNKIQQVVPQVPYENKNSSNIMISNPSNWIAFPNNSLIESSIANEIFVKNSIDNNTNMNPNDKFTLLAKVNNTIDNYSKGLPQLLDKVNKTIAQLNQNNTTIFNEQISALMKRATKSSGQTIQLHIDELISGLTDDLLFELVHDLQLIEEKKNNQIYKDNFALSVSTYYSHFKQLSSIEEDVLHKISSKRHPLTPYIPIDQVRKDNCSNIIISTPTDKKTDVFNKNIRIENQPEKILVKNKREKRTYTALVHHNIIDDCKRYIKEYSDFQKSNRNFEIPNEFGLYDELVNEKIRQILNEEIDDCIDQLDDCVNDLFHKELSKEP